ncbi:Ataxin-10, partial [Dimargaris verticillata]
SILKSLTPIDSMAETVPNEHVRALLVVTKAFSNLVTGNRAIQAEAALLWEQDRCHDFSEVMAVNDKSAKEVFSIFTLNSVSGNPPVCRQVCRTRSFTRVFKRLLEYAEDHFEQSESLFFDIAFALTREMVAAQCITSCYTQLLGVDNPEPDSTPLPFNAHTITFLKFIDAKLHRDLDAEHTENLTSAQQEPLVSIYEFLSAKLNELAQILLLQAKATASAASHPFYCLSQQLTAASQSSSDASATTPNPSISGYHIDVLVSFYTTLVLLLECLRSLTQVGLMVQAMPLLSKQLLSLCIELLAFLNARFPRMSKLGTAGQHQIEGMENAAQQFAFIKRNLVSIIGNLGHRNKTLQDLARERGGVELILGHCNIDDNNPYIKEHAVLAIRNLLEGNTENQALVQTLEPQEAVTHPDIANLGFTAELNNQKQAVLKPTKPDQ